MKRAEQRAEQQEKNIPSSCAPVSHFHIPHFFKDDNQSKAEPHRIRDGTPWAQNSIPYSDVMWVRLSTKTPNFFPLRQRGFCCLFFFLRDVWGLGKRGCAEKYPCCICTHRLEVWMKIGTSLIHTFGVQQTAVALVSYTRTSFFLGELFPYISKGYGAQVRS